MSSHPLTKSFDLAFRKIDDAWKAIARLEMALKAMGAKRPQANLPVPGTAQVVYVVYRDDGFASIRIDEQEFVLSPKLARLLEILAADTNRCPDGTVSWKSGPEVLAKLADGPESKRVTARSLNQLVYRLRKELANNGLHPGLVQYHRTKRALRFYLRP